MTILQIIKLILGVADGLLKYAQRKQLMDAGEAAATAASLSATQERIQKALAARRRPHDPGMHDPYRRD